MAEKNATESAVNKEHSSPSKYVCVKFVDQKGNETFFKALRNSRIGKTFDAYRQHLKLQHHVSFTFNGDRVDPNVTYNDLDVEDGAEFDVFSTAMGGGGACFLHIAAIPL